MIVTQSRGELRAHPSGIEEAWLRGTIWGGMSTAAGQSVDGDSAVRLTAVYACVRVLAESIGTLPLITYRSTATGKERATSHPWYETLHSQPNPEMSSVALREAMVYSLLLRGNAYLQIVPLPRGGMQLWPLLPDKMKVDRDAAGNVRYSYKSVPAAPPVVIPTAQIIHVLLMSKDGLTGLSPIAIAREEIGLGLAAREFGARLFGNGTMPGGVLQAKGPMTAEAAKRLKADWEDLHRGGENAHRVAVLEEGMTWQQISLAPEDAQFLETRKFNKAEIATLFGLPPHKIGDLEHATFTNIEHQSIDFVVHSVRPLAVRIEQPLNNRLFAGTNLYAEFLLDGLLRGDIATRYRAYAIARQWGWLSANDIRRLEGMNPLPADQGDMYLVPLNMAPADMIDQLPMPTEIVGPRSLRDARRLALLETGGLSDDDTD